ncbi:hypothetical protein VNO77_15976 [Canavalia gladiata]|uniref:Cucumisin n=1 Tax=Canavalia gladiata TaxID=3824 RepID=A0AAN9M060_CANGL
MPKNLLLLVLFCLCLPLSTQGSDQNERKPYIVYMGELPVSRTYVQRDHHHNLLATVIGDQQLARESQIHSYGKSFNGFVARLLPHEAEKLLADDNVVSVFPNKLNKLHTTRSWDFLGLTENVKRQPTEESNLIVGVLDSGIWIDCPSFNDKGYGPPPSTWKGKCGAGKSPVDEEGHGTHTASTAAGVAVKGGSVYGIGEGTVRGGVEGGRIAMYKVCWPDRGCSDADVLSGFDEAIADGVNIISASLGGEPTKLFGDSISIGSFHALKKGILTSCSAGNSGPSTHTVQNVAPWVLTVAASSIDRQFFTEVELGDGKKTSGLSINTFSPEKKMYPLISGAMPTDPSSCDYDSLTNETVKGRIVYCPDTENNDSIIKQSGGVGTIVGLPDKIDDSYTTLIPGVLVDAKTAGTAIQSYINSTKNPQAVIRKTTSRTVPAPVVASFSSRGPQSITLKILKVMTIDPSISCYLSLVDGAHALRSQLQRTFCIPQISDTGRISRTQQDHEGELKQSVRASFRIDQRSRFATSIYQRLHTGRLIELELVARDLLEPDVSLGRWGVTGWCCPMVCSGYSPEYIRSKGRVNRPRLNGKEYGWLPLPELAKLRVVFYKTQDHSIGKTLHGILDARANANVVVEPANVVAEPANVVTKQAGHSPCTCLKRHLKDPVRLASVSMCMKLSCTIPCRKHNLRRHGDHQELMLKQQAKDANVNPLIIKDDTAELGYGSGQINPVGAVDPGLVYNISMNSYIAFLCKEGYNSANIGVIIGTKGFDCSNISSPEGTDGINYPSMHIQIPPSNSSISAIFYRNVTNVGFSNSTYKAKVTAPKGLSIEVVPDTLKFSRLNQELSFKVVLKGSQILKEKEILSASLEWNDSKYNVRSPIVVYKQT